jgi:hypothetical protein
MYTCMQMENWDTLKNIPEMGERGDKGEWWRRW